ncbi:MAG: hypothetical protein KC419_04675 [Anaerolineales bacterium]|nr:hypothetical protein [Anaerolineales bacterium]
MQRKFQYVLTGAGLTLFVILGALTLLLPPAQAGNASDDMSAYPSGTDIDKDVALEEDIPSTAIIKPNDQSVQNQAEYVANSLPAANFPISQETLAEINQVPPETVDNPETNIDVVFAQVEELVSRYEATVLGKSGWLYRRYEDYLPAKFRSNNGRLYNIPLAELYPSDIMIQEEWFYVDEAGFYTESIGHMLDENGMIRLRGAAIDGYDVNLTLKEATSDAVSQFDASSLNKLPLDGNALTMLDFAPDDKRRVKAWNEDGVYMIVIESPYEEPIQLANISDESVVGSQTRFGFDLATGSLLYTEVMFQTVNGEWFTFERIAIHQLGMINELPSEAQQTLTDVSDFLREVQQ